MGIDTLTDASTELTLQLLREQYPDAILEASLHHGDAVAVFRPEFLTRIIEFLKSDTRLLFDVLIDITAVDYPERPDRFDVVYQLLSLHFNRRLCLKTPVGGSLPAIDSLTPWWGSANWLEREVWDMFGIRFNGHPDLKRILMYEEFEGHPLRKDYPIQKRQPRIGPKV
jgi:NADH-quinone oxidoreductase subunit C